MDGLQFFLKNLGLVAQSPYAFAAYIALLAAWIAILFRVQRNKQLLQHIGKLPDKDRLTALRYEMGTILPAHDLSSAQYLTYIKRRYYFIGGVLFFTVSAGLLIASWYLPYQNSGSINVDVTPVVTSVGK